MNSLSILDRLFFHLEEFNVPDFSKEHSFFGRETRISFYTDMGMLFFAYDSTIYT